MLRTPRSSYRRLDAIGLILVALLALWVGVFAGAGEGRPWPVIFLLAGLVLATAAGRALAGRPDGPVPQLVAVGVAGSLVLTWPGVLHAGGGPLGYGNGNATLASLGAIAAVSAARAERGIAMRPYWIGLAGMLAALTVATGSVAGVLALAASLGLLGLSAATRWAGFAVVGGLIVVALSVGITTAVALGSEVGGLRDRVDVRGELWASAADFARDDPVAGIGPGQFASRSAVSGDADLRWAHHGYLQVAAELGFVGLVLVAGLAGWSWTVLWVAAAEEPASATLAAVAVTVVALHGTVDYVWHFPSIPLVMAALFGAQTCKRECPCDSV